MKITINHYDEETSIITKADDLTSTEVLDKIRGLLVAVGYNESNIIESFSELYEEHKFKLGYKDDEDDKIAMMEKDLEDAHDRMKKALKSVMVQQDLPKF